MNDASTPLTIMVETPYHEDGTKPAFTEYLCADLRSGLILIILAIFPVLFVNSEEKSGFVKNIAGQTKRREWIYLSKTAGIMIFHLMAMAAYTIIHICDISYSASGRTVWGVHVRADSTLYGSIMASECGIFQWNGTAYHSVKKYGSFYHGRNTCGTRCGRYYLRIFHTYI